MSICFTHSLNDRLFFRGCTESPHRVLLCINECEADAPSDYQSFFSIRQVVLDLKTGTIQKADETIDKPIICPHFDSYITKQPHPTLSVSCFPNRTLVWTLQHDNLTVPVTLSTLIEEDTMSTLWYNALYFVANETNDIYFIIEGSNHPYYSGIVLSPRESSSYAVQNNNWLVLKEDGYPGFNEDYVLASVGYEESGHCTVVGPSDNRKTYYPVLFENIKLVAFPDSKYEMWYKFNDSGLFPFSKEGLIDTRLECVIEVKEMEILLHSYTSDKTTTFDVSEQIERYRVERPVAVRPSIVIFSISLATIILLVVAEVVSQRKMEAKRNEGEEEGNTDNENEFQMKDSLLMDDELTTGNVEEETTIL